MGLDDVAAADYEDDSDGSIVCTQVLKWGILKDHRRYKPKKKAVATSSYVDSASLEALTPPNTYRLDAGDDNEERKKEEPLASAGSKDLAHSG